MIKNAFIISVFGIAVVFCFFILFYSIIKIMCKIVHLLRLDKDVRPYPDFYYKHQDFKSFYNSSKLYFEQLNSKDKFAQEISSIYHFCVCPGGSNGGLDSNVIEVFWGHRPYATATVINQNLTISKKNLIERGAVLYYFLLDNGNVTVTLYPAKSENMQPTESEIIIDYITDPSKLLYTNIPKKHWRYFKAYMDVTSLRGIHSLYSRLIVFSLRFFHPMVIDKKIEKRKIITIISGLLKFVFTVGLSGFLLAVIQKYILK